jgi:hypothetical protein
VDTIFDLQFVAKLNWLCSPAVEQTLGKAIVKYGRFVDLIAAYPKELACPTLDVDLAWHTHQLSPKSYLNYTVSKTKTFIDHNDRVDEEKLGTSFEWTSKIYQEKYGEIYAECTCWYCESEHSPRRSSSLSNLADLYIATRVMHISSTGKLFGASKEDKCKWCPGVPSSAVILTRHSPRELALFRTGPVMSSTPSSPLCAHLSAPSRAHRGDNSSTHTYAPATARIPQPSRREPRQSSQASNKFHQEGICRRDVQRPDGTERRGRG